MRRILLVLLILIAAFGLVSAGIYFRKKDVSPEPEAGTGGALPDTSGGAGGGGGDRGGSAALPSTTVLPATKSPVVDYFVNANGVTFSIQPSGEVISASTTSAIVSSVKIANLMDARFSPGGTFILVKYGDASAPDWSVYDVQKSSWKQLGIEAFDADWAPSGTTITYIAERASSAALTTLDVKPAKLAPKTLMTFAAKDLVAKFAGSSRIMVFERSSASVQGSLWSYDLKKNALALVYENLRGLDLAWGTEDRGLLMRSKGEAAGSAELFLIDGEGHEVQAFSFLALPEKCVFENSDFLFCGLPKDAADFGRRVLPDSYRKREFATEDALYRVNLASGAIERVMDETGTHLDMTRIKIFANDLYFIDRKNGLLYKIELPRTPQQ